MQFLFFFFFALFFENLDSHIVDCRIVEHNNPAVRTRFDMHTAVLSECIVRAAKVISYCLYVYVKTVGNAVHCAVRQTVFDATQFVDSNVFDIVILF